MYTVEKNAEFSDAVKIIVYVIRLITKYYF